MLRLTEHILVVLSTCAAVLGDQTITCSSNDYRRITCSLDDNYDTIVKTTQLSGSPCTEGVSFGLNDNTVWVDNGCRATFFVTNTETTTTTAITTTTNPVITALVAPTTTANHITTALVVQTTTANPVTTAFVVQTTSAIHATTPTTTAAITTVTTEVTTNTLAVYTTTTDHTNATFSSNTTLHSGLCTCKCTITTSVQNLASVIQELRKTMTVNKSLLSSVIRKKTSASDPRTSAAVIGYSGLAFLVVLAMSIVLCDVISLARHISGKRQPV